MRRSGSFAKRIPVALKILGIYLLAIPSLSTAAKGQILPIEFIDLKCYAITGDPLNITLQLDHLNPLLHGLPSEFVTVLDPRQLCVPVAKNGRIPPPPGIDIIKYIDLKCYAIQGDPLALPLRLDHLNPVLREMGLPPEVVTLREPEKLCVPVAKNGVIPPSPAIDFIKWLDLKCYTIQGVPLNLPLTLNQLNPLFAGLPPEQVQVLDPQHLCVPVMKNQVPPPPDIGQIISMIDQKCYAIQGQPLPVLQLDHLNPVLRDMFQLPPEQLFTLQPQQLCVPVAKSPGAQPDKKKK